MLVISLSQLLYCWPLCATRGNPYPLCVGQSPAKKFAAFLREMSFKHLITK